LWSLATAVSLSPFTKVTTLSNGLTVATEAHHQAQTATMSVWIDAGLHAKMDMSNGSAHFLKHMAFKGTGHRSHHALETISSILQNSKLKRGAIEREHDVILCEQQEVDKQHEEVVFDHLHVIDYQGMPPLSKSHRKLRL
jgi:mitochondrial-processing peptidase subunit beta